MTETIENKHIAGISAQGVLPLFYNANAEVCVGIVKALYQAGISYIEFTNRGPDALKNFSQLVKYRAKDFQGMQLGIGTIKTADEARAYVDAGADYLVSPVFDNGVNDVAYLNKILWIPGCMTPTEIHNAQQAGCTFIKLFPGNVLQPGFLQAIQPLFSGTRFMVTGGVEPTKDSMGGWFEAGASAVGMGSKLIGPHFQTHDHFDNLTHKTRSLLEMVSAIRK